MRKEMAINELYNIESVENKLKGDKWKHLLLTLMD
jgi:hypothetical protein